MLKKPFKKYDKDMDNYNSLIEDTISYLSDIKKDIYFSQEDRKYFEAPKLKKREQKKIPSLKKTSALLFPKKIPILLNSTKKNEKPKPKIIFDEEDFIALEPPSFISVNQENIKKTLQNIAPNIKIHDTPYDDAKAKNISDSWKIDANIVILSFKETSQKLLFLKNLAKALEIYFYKTKILLSTSLEKENRWPIFLENPSLKIIFACDYFLFSLPNLKKYYREIPTKEAHFLKDTPLFMLPDISVYLKNPLLKASLWNSIKKMMQKL